MFYSSRQSNSTIWVSDGAESNSMSQSGVKEKEGEKRHNVKDHVYFSTLLKHDDAARTTVFNAEHANIGQLRQLEVSEGSELL